MIYLSDDEILALELRKEQLISQEYTDENSHLVERIDILLGVQDGRQPA